MRDFRPASGPWAPSMLLSEHPSSGTWSGVQVTLFTLGRNSRTSSEYSKCPKLIRETFQKKNIKNIPTWSCWQILHGRREFLIFPSLRFPPNSDVPLLINPSNGFQTPPWGPRGFLWMTLPSDHSIFSDHIAWIMTFFQAIQYIPGVGF